MGSERAASGRQTPSGQKCTLGAPGSISGRLRRLATGNWRLATGDWQARPAASPIGRSLDGLALDWWPPVLGCGSVHKCCQLKSIQLGHCCHLGQAAAKARRSPSVAFVVERAAAIMPRALLQLQPSGQPFQLASQTGSLADWLTQTETGIHSSRKTTRQRQSLFARRRARHQAPLLPQSQGCPPSRLPTNSAQTRLAHFRPTACLLSRWSSGQPLIRALPTANEWLVGTSQQAHKAPDA